MLRYQATHIKHKTISNNHGIFILPDTMYILSLNAKIVEIKAVAPTFYICLIIIFPCLLQSHSSLNSAQSTATLGTKAE